MYFCYIGKKASRISKKNQYYIKKKDLEHKNNIESFKQFDFFYYDRIIKIHGDMISRLIEMNGGEEIKFLDQDIEDVNELLSDLEIFAIKN